MAGGGLSYIVVGVAAPLGVLAANLYWNFGGVVVTVLSFLWIGFALAMLHPAED